jgi:hypothetical protein
LQALAEDVVASGDFGDGIGVYGVGAGWHGVAEFYGDVGVAGLEVEVFVADGGGAAVFGDGFDDDGEVVCIFGAVGDFDGAVDAVVANFGGFEPLEEERGGYGCVKIFGDGVGGMGGILDLDGNGEFTGLERAAGSPPAMLQV